jgi:hypothetical protein
MENPEQLFRSRAGTIATAVWRSLTRLVAPNKTAASTKSVANYVISGPEFVTPVSSAFVRAGFAGDTLP